jgi:hypothetical protein
LPRAKLILILRNPVDRAYSHYHHTVRIGLEPLSFEDAIEKESERIEQAWRKLKEDERSFSPNLFLYSYLYNGIYIDQVKVLMDLFPMEKVLILKSEDFFEKTSMILNEILEFLGLQRLELEENMRKHNNGRYNSMNPITYKRLTNYFKPYNSMLYSCLGRDFGWDE